MLGFASSAKVSTVGSRLGQLATAFTLRSAAGAAADSSLNNAINHTGSHGQVGNLSRQFSSQLVRGALGPSTALTLASSRRFAAAASPPAPTSSVVQSAPAVQVTAAALQRFQYLLSRRKLVDPVVTLSVKEKGCAGLSYTVDFVSANDTRQDMQPSATFDFPEANVKLLIDRKSLGFLIGTEIDWQEGEISSQFVFKNPNSTHSCPCGRSFAA